MKSHAEVFKIRHLRYADGVSLTALLRASWQQVRRWQALYRQRQQLASLSDGMLKDIGLSRADIETESNRPFWDDPSRRG